MVGKLSAQDFYLKIGLAFARQTKNEACLSTAQEKTAKNDERHTVKTGKSLKAYNAQTNVASKEVYFSQTSLL